MSTTMDTVGRKRPDLALLLINKQHWMALFMVVAAIGIAGLVYLGAETYTGAPPTVDFNTTTGDTAISAELITKGEEVFHLRGLMNYGSFWGDGAQRGPDFTADALHQTVHSMRAFYENELPHEATQYDRDAIAVRVTREIKTNTWDEETGQIGINPAQVFAFEELNKHYTRMFTDPEYPEFYGTANFINDPEQIRALTAFFYWGGWVSGASRPGETYSYTHNWPYDPEAGNVPTSASHIWSFLSILALGLGVWVVLYAYGQMKTLPGEPFESTGVSLTTYDLEHDCVRPTQRATYKFFALAMFLFVAQILAGILTVSDFVRPFGLNFSELIPFTVARSYHALFQIMWFFMCWVGYTIFFLPRLSKVPNGQKFLINLLFALCLIVGFGSLIGIYLGQSGILTGSAAYWFGSQGWEFMEMGRLFQLIMLAAFALWITIIYRGVKPWLNAKNLWSVPAWLLYGSGIMVAFLFFGLMVTPDTNFAISDYWRWMVVHMWVEVTFEVFTTVIVAYMLVQMGLVTRQMAERIIFLAVMLFLVTATLGISHNFYWIAKPTGIIAVGSVFSTLQVLPLLLLTLDAWKMREEGSKASESRAQGKQKIVMEGVWMFILAVNFWNIFGAGVLGSLINLPIVNYFEHATYLTGNHAHAAMFGVKGNIALAGMLFCCMHLFPASSWNPRLIRISFWSLNIGVALMMFLDLFPVGLYQLWTTMQDGYWAARSQELVQGTVFQTLTYFRSIGGIVFVVGGLCPLVWFIWSRGSKLRPEADLEEGEWTVYETEWAGQEDPILSHSAED